MSAILLWRHVSFWQSLDARRLDAPDLAYFRRQYRRRIWTSTIIGVIGVVITAGDLVRSAVMGAFYLAGLVLLVLCILLLAGVDLLSTTSYLRESRKRRLSQKRELEAEVRRLRKQYGSKNDGRHDS